MTDRISKASQILHEEGFLVLTGRLLLFLKHILFSYSSYNIYESALNPPGITCKVKDLEIRMITSVDEIEHLESEQSTDEGFDFPRDKEVVSKGAVLFCAFVGKELAYTNIAYTSRASHKIYPFSFAMPYGNTVGLAPITAPKYRRKGIHSYARIKTLQFLKEQGISKAWDVQDKDNIAARNAIVKLGGYLLGEGCNLRLLSLFTIEWTKPLLQGVSSHIRIRCERNK